MAERSFLGSGATFYLDATDLQQRLNEVRSQVTEEKFRKIAYRTFKEVARKSRVLVAREVVKDYHVNQAWVKGHFDPYKVTFGGIFPVTCQIPMRSPKGSVGGRFPLSGQAFNSGPNGVWGHRKATKKRQEKYWKMQGSGRIRAKIVKTGVSTLPKKMVNQGGNAPFLAHGVAFTRRYKTRLPIVRVVALGTPQLPLNRSEDRVQEVILDFAMDRLMHNYDFMTRKS